MNDHELLLLLTEVVVVVLAARAGSELAIRAGVPQIVGELTAGMLIGPSVLGLLWPAAFDALFPADPGQRALLDLFAWVGVVFLLVTAAHQASPRLLRGAGRTVAATSVAGFGLPFAAGIGLGWLIPAAVAGPGADRVVFALFLATAMSISALPVVVAILLELGLLRTRLGMVVTSAALLDDLLGWILLAAITGLATGGVAVGSVATTIAGVAALLVASATVGRRAVRCALAAGRRLRAPHANLTVMLTIVVIGGALTQALHVHLVFGAFVAALLVAHSPDRDPAALASISQVGLGFFVPFFFGYAGVKVDLTTVQGDVVPVLLSVLAVACASKLVGGSLGARLGGFGRWEAAAVGCALNARGAMELVIAAIGLSIGILTTAMYSVIVVVALVTTLMAAPLIRWCVGRAALDRSRRSVSSGSAPQNGRFVLAPQRPRISFQAIAQLAAIADYTVAFAVRAVGRLGVADCMTGGPRHVDELAAATGTHAPSLLRVLRALAFQGVVTEPKPERFQLTAMGELMRSDHPFSMRGAFRLHPDVEALCALDHSVRTGEPSFDHVHGESYWDHLARRPALLDEFCASQRALTRLELVALLRAYDWSGIRTVVDIGGSDGTFISQLLARHRAMTAVMLDLPDSAAAAPAVLAAAGVADRCDVVAGSFFEVPLPPCADAYVIKRVLVGLGDDQAAALLRSARAAMGPDSRLLVVEPMLRDDDELSVAMDVLMLVLGAGRVRTPAEFEDLFDRAGLSLKRTIPAGPVSVAEARPVRAPAEPPTVVAALGAGFVF